MPILSRFAIVASAVAASIPVVADDYPAVTTSPESSQAEASVHHYSFESDPVLVSQDLVIRFASEEACAAAQPRIAPLLNDAAWAVSGRWDDNNETNLEAMRRMKARGMAATFYLNSNDIWYLNGQDYEEQARAFLDNGFSIGGHGATHPYLTGTNRNRFFYETAAVRIEWETRMDAPVVSYAFSFVNYRNSMEGDPVHEDVLRSLDRAGYFHLAIFKHTDDQFPSDFAVTPILPPENQPLSDFQQAFDWLTGSTDLKDQYASASNSMHSWYGTPALEYGWDEFERRLDILAGRENFWYDNHNAIGSYRYQQATSRIDDVHRDGKTMTLTLLRPSIADANDSVPLTIAFDGINSSDLVGGEGRTLVNVPRPSAQQPPDRIYHVPSQSAAAIDGAKPPVDLPPALSVSLETADDAMHLNLKNEGTETLTDIQVRWRLPIAWARPPMTEAADLEPGSSVRLAAPLDLVHDDEFFTGGDAYFVAQIDALQGDDRIRVYATDLTRGDFPNWFAGGRFSALGPIDRDHLDWDALQTAFPDTDVLPDSWTSADGTEYTWRDAPADGIIEDGVLSPDIVRTNGDWYKLWCPGWVLAANVESEEQQIAVLRYYEGDSPFVLLNGKLVTDGQVSLRKGPNLLVIPHFFNTQPGDPRHVGCHIRLDDPETGERLTNIVYRFPPRG